MRSGFLEPTGFVSSQKKRAGRRGPWLQSFPILQSSVPTERDDDSGSIGKRRLGTLADPSFRTEDGVHVPSLKMVDGWNTSATWQAFGEQRERPLYAKVEE